MPGHNLCDLRKFIFSADTDRAKKRYHDRASLFATEDATVAASFAHLAATSLGLGSVWIGAFTESAVQEVLGIPENLVII